MFARLALASALVSLTLAACGDGDGDGSNAGPQPPMAQQPGQSHSEGTFVETPEAAAAAFERFKELVPETDLSPEAFAAAFKKYRELVGNDLTPEVLSVTIEKLKEVVPETDLSPEEFGEEIGKKLAADTKEFREALAAFTRAFSEKKYRCDGDNIELSVLYNTEVSEYVSYGTVNVIGVEKEAQFQIQGINPRWDWSPNENGEYEYAIIISSDNWGRFYNFKNSEIAKPTDVFRCSEQ